VYPVLSLSLDCPFLIGPSVFSDAYLSFVLCTQSYHCLWIVYSWLVLRFSLTLICPVSWVPSATIVSGLYIPDWFFGFLWRLFVLCLLYPVLPLSLDCPFLIDPWVFSDAYLSCMVVAMQSVLIVTYVVSSNTVVIEEMDRVIGLVRTWFMLSIVLLDNIF
jgi:hypothetical protein